MRKDFHTHPKLMQDPARVEGYIARAKELGIGEICLTDHMPLSVSNAADRIPAGQVKEYLRRGRELAERYAGEITIRVGIELDYHPDFVGEVEDALSAGDFDHRLASSHLHLFYDQANPPTYAAFAREALENLCRATELPYFTAAAHLDMFRWVFRQSERFPLQESPYDWRDYEDLIREIFRNMKARGMHLEINPHFAEKTADLALCYPERPILSLARAEGISFCYGSDAHRASSVGAMLTELANDPDYGPALRSWEKT
ncbi:MAG: PHP domain-containing protein [Clostridia bacterium]|nr:PHP domain-containing protein [Clostridia bacterium]